MELMKNYSSKYNELLTLKEAAKFLKVHPETIRRWYLRKGLVGLKHGRTLRFSKDDLIEFLKVKS